MAQEHIAEDLQRFIAAHIDSIAHIEALMLLQLTAPTGWTPSALADRIYADEGTATSVLRRLHADGLAVLIDDRYRFECESADKESMVLRLLEAYRVFLIPVTNLIHAKPLKIRQFADAFKLRKDS